MAVVLCGSMWLALLIVRFYIAYLDEMQYSMPPFDLPPLKPPVVRQQFKTWYDEQWESPSSSPLRDWSWPRRDLRHDQRKHKPKRKRKRKPTPASLARSRDDWR